MNEFILIFLIKLGPFLLGLEELGLREFRISKRVAFKAHSKNMGCSTREVIVLMSLSELFEGIWR